MKIALAQIDTIIGDFDNNLRIVEAAVQRARAAGADIVVLPELTFSGYPPKDLVEKHSYVEKNLEILDRFQRGVHGIAALVGFISRNESSSGKPLYNSAAFIADGRMVNLTHKCLLPTYDVFDEGRHFEPYPKSRGLVSYKGTRIAVTICEDIWNDAELFPHRLYAYDPVEDLAGQGAALILNISASPFTLNKPALRRNIAVHAARKYGAAVIMVNQVGGNDDIVFDGNSLAVNRAGQIIAQAHDFQEDFVLADLGAGTGDMRETAAADVEAATRALVLGIRDYTRKCGFSQVVIGLSGGIDSALVACLAATALGPENVLGVAMPSPFSSPGSVRDAQTLSRNLGIRLETVPIHAIYQNFLHELQPIFGDRPFGVAEENLQARIRGNILMAISNKFGAMVLSTGNKSELAVGYSTLYGDMCGGLAVISDLLKTRVYEMARWINRNGEVIPRSSLEKPPSAELRPEQTDQDDLPPYGVLDTILELYIEEQKSRREITARGMDPETVDRIIRMVDRNEYKRRQAPPGLKITGKAFGYGRRLPIVQRFTN